MRCWSPVAKTSSMRPAGPSTDFFNTPSPFLTFDNITILLMWETKDWHCGLEFMLLCKSCLPVTIFIITISLGVNKMLPYGYFQLRSGYPHSCQVGRSQKGQKTITEGFMKTYHSLLVYWRISILPIRAIGI